MVPAQFRRAALLGQRCHLRGIVVVKVTRRTLLKAAAGLPVALALPASPTQAAPALVLQRGWVLRADDLARLGRR
jgi:hypothetical protein